MKLPPICSYIADAQLGPADVHGVIRGMKDVTEPLAVVKKSVADIVPIGIPQDPSLGNRSGVNSR